MALSNIFGNTNTGIIGKINSAVGFNTPAPSNQLGTNAVAPKAPAAPLPTLATSQVKPTTAPVAPKSSFNQDVYNQQVSLNAKGAGLKTDGIMGPLTQAAIQKYSQPVVGTQVSHAGMPGSASSTPQGDTTGQPQVVTYTRNAQGQTVPVNSQSGQADQTQNTSTYSQNTPNLYGQIIADLANRSTQSGADYQSAQAEAQRIQDEQTKLAQDYAQKTNNIAGTAGFLTQQAGLQGQLQNQYNTGQGALASQYAGATNRLSAANTQQGLLQQALATAAGYAQPQFQSYTNAQFNPVTGQYGTVGGGQYGSGPEAVSNITSRQQAQTGINDIQQKAPAIDNQFSALVNYANQAGLTGSVPILQGLKQKFGVAFESNPIYQGFNQAIGALNKLLSEQGEEPLDLNTVTQAKIQQAQQTVKGDLARKQSSYQNYLSGNSSSTGGTMFGSFFGK